MFSRNCIKFIVPHIALRTYDPLNSIAERLFDPKLRLNPDAMAPMVAAMLSGLRQQAERRKLGVTFSQDMRFIQIREEWPGAEAAAEIDKGEVGSLLRSLRRRGFLSTSDKVLAAMECRARGEESSTALAYLRKVRKRKATLLEEAQADAAKRRADELHGIVTRGNAWIDQDVRATPDCRDVATGWPVRWHKTSGSKMKVPIPITNPHERSGTSWAATNHKEPSMGGMYNHRLASGQPITAAPDFGGDCPASKPESVFDRSAVGHRHGIETKFGAPSRHGITNEGLALQEAAIDANAVELPSSAQFEQVIPDDNDATNVVRLPQKKPKPLHSSRVMLKSVRGG